MSMQNDMISIKQEALKMEKDKTSEIMAAAILAGFGIAAWKIKKVIFDYLA